MARVWKFEDNVNTDIITPGRFNLTTNQQELGSICFKEVRPDFDPNDGDIIVAGENFGSGSSRETAPVAIKAAGIGAIVARSFARIFYRNAINIGLHVYASYDAYENYEDGDSINIEEVSDLVEPSGFAKEIIQIGGIREYLKKYGSLRHD